MTSPAGLHHLRSRATVWLSVFMFVVVLLLNLAGVVLVTGTVIESMDETGDIRALPAAAAATLIRTDGTFVHAVQRLAQRVAGDFLDFYSVSWITLVTTAVGIIVSSVIGYHGYRLFFTPMNRVRLLGEVGYIPEQGLRSKDMVNVVKKRRLVGQLPPVYPNGWFNVIESRDLKKGDVKSVGCLGLNLAVFRGEDGRAQVLDAYCPHMGANLAAGGLVRGNCLECPFHGWQFRGDDGKCVHIPYIDDRANIPDSARVKSYLVLERNGFVYIWYHAEDNEPDWEPEEIPDIASGEWTYGGRTEHIVSAHIEEIPENGADVAHLSQVHSPIMTSGVDLRYVRQRLWQFAEHHWDGNWEMDATDKHVGTLSLKHSITVFGKGTRIFDMNVQAKQIGPGIVYLSFDSSFGRGYYLQSLTPSEPLTQRMIHHVYFSKTTPTFIAKFFLLGEALQIERDIMIWNNKTFQNRPVFVKSREDTLVAKHRRWYSQFYSEHSPRFGQQHKNSLEW